MFLLLSVFVMLNICLWHANYRKNGKHLKTPELVLARLKDYGEKVNPAKCKFFQDSFVFCVDKERIHKTEDKVAEVINAPRLQDISELCTWADLVDYHHRFLPNLSAVPYQFNQLLQIDEMAFVIRMWPCFSKNTKKMIASDLVLALYENLPLKLHCDDSSRGLGDSDIPCTAWRKWASFKFCVLLSFKSYSQTTTAK